MKAMMHGVQRRVLLSLMLTAGVGLAQKYEPPPPPLTVDPCAVQPNPKFPITPDPKAKPVVCPPPAAAGAKGGAPAGGPPTAPDAFPFPGDAAPAKAPAASGVKGSAADAFPYPGSGGPGGAVPAVPPAAAKGSSSGDKFPYPGETSSSPDAVPEGDTPRYVPDAPAPGSGGAARPGAADDAGSSSSSSSSSRSGGSSSSAGGDGAAPEGEDTGRAAEGSDPALPRKGRRALPKVSAQSADERVAEDLSVAKFYSDHGNFQAAYLRSKDATKALPDDPESHFVLAQAAEKLRKKDEAVAEYREYLRLEPSGERAGAAQRALGGLR